MTRNNIHPSVFIGKYCLIGEPPEWKGQTENKGVSIGKGTILTGLVTIDGGAEKQTKIGSNCYFMKHSHVGHDCIIGNNVVLSCGVKIGGHTTIGDNCNIGMNAVIHQRQNIAEGCMIGMGAVVTKGLITKPNCKYVGNPAKYLSINYRP